jgi:hypothetical protein
MFPMFACRKDEGREPWNCLDVQKRSFELASRPCGEVGEHEHQHHAIHTGDNNGDDDYEMKPI